MFSTPVGGAAVLGLVFSLISLYLIVAVVIDAVKKAGARMSAWAKSRLSGRCRRPA